MNILRRLLFGDRMEEVVIGGIYRHFKGREMRYRILVIGKGVDNPNEPEYKFLFKARDCGREDEEVDVLERIIDNKFFLRDMSGDYVVYEQLYESDFPNGTIWARELSDFVGYKEFADGSRVKRFEMVNER